MTAWLAGFCGKDADGYHLPGQWGEVTGVSCHLYLYGD